MLTVFLRSPFNGNLHKQYISRDFLPKNPCLTVIYALLSKTGPLKIHACEPQTRYG